MKTVVMKPYLSYLPMDSNDKIKNSFFDEFLNELKKNQNASKNTNINLKLDYVRLNIMGRK